LVLRAKEGVQGSHEPMEKRGSQLGPVARLGAALCTLVSARLTQGGVRVGTGEMAARPPIGHRGLTQAGLSGLLLGFTWGGSTRMKEEKRGGSMPRKRKKYWPARGFRPK
jgi:hypothetical protein